MKSIHFSNEVAEAHQFGNKGLRLAMLTQAGFNVPAFFAVSPDAFDEHEDIAIAMQRLCPDDALVAVRSSSLEEDGAQSSFAGQFDSYLNISGDDVAVRVADVSQSACSERIRSYRQSQGLDGELQLPAVVVQRMIDAQVSGVAFAADPISGDRDIAVVAAARGLGENLVSGEVQGDTWRIDSRSRIVQREIVADDGEAVLKDKQVKQIARLVRKVTIFFGKPQDIEWAIDRGQIHLLQSRDITTLANRTEQAAYALWDNSNIVESYGGVTTPLTFSVARGAYEEAYRHFGRVLGVSERAIRDNRRTYEQMIGLIQGRVYYNLLNWYRLLMLTPGFRFNSGFMEQMMGVTEGLPESVVPNAEDGGLLAAMRAKAGLLRVAYRLIVKLFAHNRRVRKFHCKMDKLLAPVELDKMSVHELIDYYDGLQAEVIPAWDTPLINDLYCMIFHGALRKLCTKWLNEGLTDIHNDLIGGGAGIISLEPVKRMRELAAIAKSDRGLESALVNGSLVKINQHIERNAGFRKAYYAYIERFGDRCLDELKLESRTLADDPLPMLRAVGQLSRVDNSASGGLEAMRLDAERSIDEALGTSTLRRRIFDFALSLARARIRDRENLRFERTRVYGRVRALFVAIGNRLHNLDVLEKADDIFYLDDREISGLIRGTGSCAEVKALVSARRNEFKDYASASGPPRRFVTCGPAQLESSIQLIETESVGEHENARKGQACSPGIVRGPVRVVTDPRTATIRSGDILVAERTDPGWVTIFPLVKGVIMERGSLLSHSAIVSRELGLPAVVGVENACRWLQDGDWVELNGATGQIRRLESTECAA
jgi:rifampicin phosphotransferase